MNNKQSNVVSSLLRYAGNKKSDLYKSIFWAIIGELFGMVPFIAIAKLIEKIYLYEATFKTVIYITLIAPY